MMLENLTTFSEAPLRAWIVEVISDNHHRINTDLLFQTKQ